MEQDSIPEKSKQNITLSYHHGYLYPHHRLVTYFTTEYINGFDLSLSQNLTGLNPGNPPEIGGGYYFSNLGSREIYGYTHGLYIFIGRDFLRNKSPVFFQHNVGTGASFNTRRFDINENYSNRLIGSHVNIFLIYSLSLKARIGNRTLLSIGPCLVHTSNGNLKQPNFGLNLLNTRFSLTYVIDRKLIPLKFSTQNTSFNKLNRYQFILAGGIRELSHRIPDYYVVGSFITDYTRKLGEHFALGFGMDFIIDASEGREPYVTGQGIDNFVPWHIGAHMSIERIWNHVSLVINPGYKIVTPSRQFNYQYNRIGLRYRFDNHMVLNYTIKSHRIAADFIEFGIGYIIE